MVTNDISKKRAQSNSKGLVGEQHQRIAIECLPRIETTLEEVQSTNNALLELESKRQTTEAKITDIREQSKKFHEDLVSAQTLIENLSKMLTDMKYLSDSVMSKSATGPNIMDFDNTFTWKINLLNLFNDNSLPIYSAPFQSSQWGYRIKMGMSTHTIEQSKERFIVPSFTILRGDYDSILEWPFPYLITLSLVDLTGQQKHITHSIQLDATRAAIFGEPLGETNTSCQISGFYSIAKLAERGSNYVQDDNIFIRTHIDFTKTSVHLFQSRESLKTDKSA